VPLPDCAFLFPFTSLLPFKVAFCLQAVGLRGYAQRDPLVEYKLEGYNLFLEMMANIRRNTIYNVYMFQPAKVTLNPILPHALSIHFATIIYICNSLHLKHLLLKHNFSRVCFQGCAELNIHEHISPTANLGCQRSAGAGLLHCVSLCHRYCCTIKVQAHYEMIPSDTAFAFRL